MGTNKRLEYFVRPRIAEKQPKRSLMSDLQNVHRSLHLLDWSQKMVFSEEK